MAQPLTDAEKMELKNLHKPLVTALGEVCNQPGNGYHQQPVKVDVLGKKAANDLSSKEHFLKNSSLRPFLSPVDMPASSRSFTPYPSVPKDANAIFKLMYEGMAEVAQASDLLHVLQLITNFAQGNGWHNAVASLREPSHFQITHLASAGLTDEEHDGYLRAQDGLSWWKKFGAEFDQFRYDDWYYIPYMEQQNEPQTSWHAKDLLYLPIRSNPHDDPIGLLQLSEPLDQEQPTIETMRALQLFCKSAALMLEKQILSLESTRHFAATRVVQDMATLVSSSHSFCVEDIIKQLTNELVVNFDYLMVTVYLREGERFVMVEHSGRVFEEFNHVEGLMAEAIQAKQAAWAPSQGKEPNLTRRSPIFTITNQIVVPMVRQADVLGLIHVKSTSARPLTGKDKELLETLSDQLTTALINVQRFNEAQQRALQLKTASEVSRRVTSILNIDQLLAEVVKLIQDNFQYYQVQIFLYESQSNSWVMREGSGVGTASMKEVRYSYRNEEGIVGQVGTKGMSILFADVSEEPIYVFNPYSPNTKAALGVPLRLGAQVLGVLHVQSDKIGGLTVSDRAIMETLANQVVVALRNAQLFSKIQTQLSERELLYAASTAISGAQDLKMVLNAIMQPLAVPNLVRSALLISNRITTTRREGELQVAAVWDAASSSSENGKELAWGLPGMRLGVETLPAVHRLALAQNEVQIISHIGQEEHFEVVTQTLIQQLGIYSLALIPLRTPRHREGVVGSLLLMSNRADGLTADLLHPYQTLADQAALAVERVQLLAQTQQRAKRLAALNTLSTSITASLDLQKTLNDSVCTMARLFRIEQSGLLLFEQNNTYGRLVAQYRQDGYQHPEEILIPLVGNPLIDRMLTTSKPIYIRDVNTDPLAVIIREGKHPRSYTALLVVPLLIRDRVIGSISLDVVKGAERDFEPEEIKLAETMAAQVAAAIEKAQLYKQATQHAHHMETASQVGQHLTRMLNEETMLRDVVRLVAKRFNFYQVGIYLRDSDYTNRLSLHAAYGPLAHQRRHTHRIWKGQGLPGCVLNEGQTMIANHVNQDKRFQRHGSLPKTASQAAIPLAWGGELLGVLDIHSTRAGVFQRDLIAILSNVADQIAIALQNARLFAAQRETVHRLQEVDRLKSEFLASMSHELRTPLNSIIGFAKIILRGIDGPLTDLQRQDLGAIYRSGQHLLALINDILDLSKIAAGKMELTLARLHIAEVGEEVLQQVSPQAAEKMLRLESHYEENLPPVLADRIRVRQILLNLLSNAIKFTEKGKIQLTCRRVAHVQPSEGQKACVGDLHGKFIEIAVKDTGIGIKPEDEKILFEAFRQLGGPAARRAGGTGLGLAIARRFAELHNTSLWVESHYGMGSTFRFTLPLLPEETR